ncbi:GNAT family N-acetyltransferase [Aquirufa nivalisilvae]
MIINLSKFIRLYLSRPVWIEILGSPQLELYLPIGGFIGTKNRLPEGYLLRTFQQGDEEMLSKLYLESGFSFSKNQFPELFSACLPNGCFVVEHIETKDLVATMMARHHSSKDYPFGGRIDWLASSPHHRLKGLGNICASAASKRLLEAGYSNIWVTTDDFRLGAIKIFTSLGFRPVINKETESRWGNINNLLDLTLHT